MAHIHGREIYDPNCRLCRGICRCATPRVHWSHEYCRRCLGDIVKDPKRELAIVFRMPIAIKAHMAVGGAAVFPITILRLITDKTLVLREDYTVWRDCRAQRPRMFLFQSPAPNAPPITIARTMIKEIFEGTRRIYPPRKRTRHSG